MKNVKCVGSFFKFAGKLYWIFKFKLVHFLLPTFTQLFEINIITFIAETAF